MSGVPRLLGSRGDGIGEWPLDESRPLLIGRNRQCDVVLEDDAVSRRHLAVQPLAGGGWEVVDLGSSSGTWINEVRVTQHRLRSGDRIVVGRTELLAVDIDRPAVEESATPVSAGPPPVPRTMPPPAPKSPPALPPPPPASLPPLPRRASPPPIPVRAPQPPPRESTPPRRPPPRGRSSAPGPSRRTGLWSGVALVAVVVIAAGGWFGWTHRDRFRAPVPTPAVAPTPAPPSYSEAAARALLQPSTDGAPRTTPLGSFTTTAAGGKLEHAEVTLEVPAGALPDGRSVTVSRVDAAPAAMRDGFPVTHFGDLTPLSAIFLIETGTDAPTKPLVVSLPLPVGARFTSLAVLTWSPATSAWELFPARLDPARGRAVAELGRLQYVHLLGAEEGGETK